MLVLLDCKSLLESLSYVQQTEMATAKLLYGRLKEILIAEFENINWSYPETWIAFVSIDPNAEPQQQFVKALSTHFSVEKSNYRDNIISGPIIDKRSFMPITLAPRISYALGKQAQKTPVEVVVVSHEFELYYPLTQLSYTKGARVGLAFFSSMLDRRWKNVGILERDSKIKLFKLDQYIKEIFDFNTRKTSNFDVQPQESPVAGL